MGRLSQIKQTVSPFLNKEILTKDATTFTLVDINEVDSVEDEGKGYWKISVVLEGSVETKYFTLSKGKRDLEMIGISDALAEEGPIDKCRLVCRPIGKFKVPFYIIVDVEDDSLEGSNPF